MDLREDLINYLDSSGFDDFTKIRYIYLYVCDKFSYDVRFMYARKSLKEKIYNKKIDIANVEDFEIVCYTYCHVLVDMLALYGFKGTIVREGDGQFQHAYVILKYKDMNLKLDPTIRHDSTRVKMKSSTKNFESDNEYIFDQLLKDADAQIDASSNNKIDLSVFYNDESIKQLVDVIESNAVERGLTPEQLFYEKLDSIFCLVNTRTDFSRYDDIDFYLGYLMAKFEINAEGNYVKPAVFFKTDDDLMREIINIIMVEYKESLPIFFILKKENKNFKVSELSASEVIDVLEEYDNFQVSYYFIEKAKSALANNNKM